jgi:hypothetical protein
MPFSPPNDYVSTRRRDAHTSEAQTQEVERSDSRESGTPSPSDLTVVSGYLECFVVIAILMSLGIAFHTLGILE